MLYTTESLEVGVLATLMQMIATEAPRLVGEFCTVIQSDGESEKHEWLGQLGTLEEWGGTRKYTDPTGTSYTIPNLIYDGAVAITREQMADNRSGSIQQRINQFFQRAVAHPNKVVNAKIVAGTTDLCYDGTAFFGNSHTARRSEGGVQDNLRAGTGTTIAQITADISAQVLTPLQTFKDESGENFHGDGFNDLVIYCPPAMAVNMNSALNATMISSSDNPIKGVARVVVGNRLTDVNDWYGFVVDPGRKPMIWQAREPLTPDATGIESEAYKEERIVKAGASYRAGCGYGYWQSAVKVVNA
jgi:phage major head subunit gpT-like protein